MKFKALFLLGLLTSCSLAPIRDDYDLERMIQSTNEFTKFYGFESPDVDIRNTPHYFEFNYPSRQIKIQIFDIDYNPNKENYTIKQGRYVAYISSYSNPWSEGANEYREWLIDFFSRYQKKKQNLKEYLNE